MFWRLPLVNGPTKAVLEAADGSSGKRLTIPFWKQSLNVSKACITSCFAAASHPLSQESWLLLWKQSLMSTCPTRPSHPTFWWLWRKLFVALDTFRGAGSMPILASKSIMGLVALAAPFQSHKTLPSLGERKTHTKKLRSAIDHMVQYSQSRQCGQFSVCYHMVLRI